MKTWVRRSLNAGALTAGALLVTGGVAEAGPTMDSTDNFGVANGTQVYLPIQAPINVCGNAVGVLGAAYAGCEGGAAAALNPEWRFDHYRRGGGTESTTMTSSRNVGLLNGTQLAVPVQVPVNVCGNAIAVAGLAAAGCEGGADARIGPPDVTKPDPKKPGHKKPDYQKPGHKKPGHKPGQKQYDHHEYEAGSGSGESGSGGGASAGSGGTTMTTSGNVGLLNGTQVNAPIQVPVNVCGNAVTVLGVAVAGCEGGAAATNR